MSDSYRPPSGPKGKRNSKDPRQYDNNARGNTPSGPKRYQDRDNYRPNDTYKPHYKNSGSQTANGNPIPSGPSSGSQNSRPQQNRPQKPRQQQNRPPLAKNPQSRPPLPSGPSGMRRNPNQSNQNSSQYPPQYNKQGQSPQSSSYRNVNGYQNPNVNGYQNPNANSYQNANVNGYKNPNSNGYQGNNKRTNTYNNQRFDGNKRTKPNPPRGGPPPAKQSLNKNQIYLIKSFRDTEVYQRTQQVGEGTYGRVYKAKNEVTGEFVALKRLRLESEREGFPITAIREIKLLQSFDHRNVIGLLEMMVEQNQIYMIFDYMEHDLTGLLTHPDLKLEECHRKFIFKQLIEGLNYLHRKMVIHRDIKGSNILIDNIGRLKIADFGLARTMKIVKDGESPDYTNRVITIWYRPPELLLGSTDYGREIDVWGVGCLLIELYTKHAAFQGFDEVSQLHRIYNIMGTPDLEDWAEIQNLPWYEMLKPKINKLSTFEQQYKEKMSEDAFNLAEKLLELNPDKRLTAAQALQHDYFTKDPIPEPLFFLKELKGEWHEFETKKRRREERKRLQEEKEKSKESKSLTTNESPSTLKSAPQTEREDEHKSNEEDIPPTAPPAEVDE